MMTNRFARRFVPCLLGLAVSLGATAVRADVRLPSLIGDHMVLQRQAGDSGVWIWGKAGRDEAVEVRLGSARARAVGDDHGCWACQLTGLPPAGGPYDLTISGKNTVTLHDVVVGEVWLCSGQSNMGFTMNETMNHEAEISAADHPMIRLFSVKHQVAVLPEEDPQGEWVVCSPKTVRNFSAVGYFYGRELRRNLHVPVGLIDGSWGGTPAEAWTPLETLYALPELRPAVSDLARNVMKSARLPTEIAEYDRKLTVWKEDKAQGQADDNAKPHDPRNGTQIDQNSPGALYNGMIAALFPYSLRGTIWYQGESNINRAGQYQSLLSAMIGSWREGFAAGDHPFYIVQLANFEDRKAEPTESKWAAVREAQEKVARAVSGAGLAVSIDLGEARNIHPTNKQEVGRRLALLAEARTYGEKVVAEGPVYQGIKIEGDKVRVSFAASRSALVSHGGATVQGFAVAGDDHRFGWAEATVDGSEVVVHSARVAKPVAVRYGWADNPEVGLYNEAGLPASPFRSDDWEKAGVLPEESATKADPER